MPRPSRLRGEPVTTATDVYALGILLYVLLTGQRPYDVRHRSPAEVERIVCEIDPPRPSAVVSDAAATTEHRELSARQRRTSPDRLCRALRGDLDTIVMQALRKEPARRYASAAALQKHRRFRERRPSGPRRRHCLSTTEILAPACDGPCREHRSRRLSRRGRDSRASPARAPRLARARPSRRPTS